MASLLPKLILLSWALPSAVLYILVLIFLIKNRSVEPFSKHFYHLFISLGVSDLFGATHTYVVQLFRFWGWINYGPIFNQAVFGWFCRMIAGGGTFLFGWTSYLGVLAIAGNRYCCLACPEKWTTKVQKLVLLVQWSVPCIFVLAPRLTHNYTVFENNSTEVVYLAVRMEMPYRLTYFVLLGVVGPTVISVAVGILYYRMYANVTKLKTDFGLNDSDKSEIRLAAVGFVVFLLMVFSEVAALLNIVTYEQVLEHKMTQNLFKNLMYFSLSLFSLCNGWLLLICSKITRNSFICWFGFRSAGPLVIRVEPIN